MCLLSLRHDITSQNWMKKIDTLLQYMVPLATLPRRLLLCRDCLQPLQLVGDQSPTSRRPVGNLSATTKNLSTIDLVAERFYSQQPKPPCDQIVPATFCNRSATSRRPPYNHPATSLRPPEILVARRSPNGCKLCVTGAVSDRFANWGLRKMANILQQKFTMIFFIRRSCVCNVTELGWLIRECCSSGRYDG